MNIDHFYWNQTKDTRLIELVTLMPELHNVNSWKYNDIMAKRNAWKKIGATMMIEPFKCEERWEYLKAVLCRDAKEASTSQTESPSSDWKVANKTLCKEFKPNKGKLCAIVDHLHQVKQTNDATNGVEPTMKTLDLTITNQQLLEGTDLCIDEPEKVLSPTNINFQANLDDKEKTSKASKNENVQKPIVDQNSVGSLDVFFLFMAHSVKSFNTADQHLIKVKLFELVHSTEAKYISNQNSNERNVPINASRNSSMTPPCSLVPPLGTAVTQAIRNRRVSQRHNPYEYFYNPRK